jgi:hypothetical protein
MATHSIEGVDRLIDEAARLQIAYERRMNPQTRKAVSDAEIALLHAYHRSDAPNGYLEFRLREAQQRYRDCG